MRSESDPPRRFLRPPNPVAVAMHDLIPLAQLHAGTRAAVDCVVGRPDDVHRLEELGLRAGTAVEMVQPGSPCIIRLAGNKLCIRADEIVSVLVRPESGE
jgi:Fe2+ transport system protein FeoA